MIKISIQSIPHVFQHFEGIDLTIKAVVYCVPWHLWFYLLWPEELAVEYLKI